MNFFFCRRPRSESHFHALIPQTTATDELTAQSASNHTAAASPASGSGEYSLAKNNPAPPLPASGLLSTSASAVSPTTGSSAASSASSSASSSQTPTPRSSAEALPTSAAQSRPGSGSGSGSGNVSGGKSGTQQQQQKQPQQQQQQPGQDGTPGSPPLSDLASLTRKLSYTSNLPTEGKFAEEEHFIISQEKRFKGVMRAINEGLLVPLPSRLLHLRPDEECVLYAVFCPSPSKRQWLQGKLKKIKGTISIKLQGSFFFTHAYFLI